MSILDDLIVARDEAADLNRLLTDILDMVEWYKTRNGMTPAVVIGADLTAMASLRGSYLGYITEIGKDVATSIDNAYPEPGGGFQ